MVGKPEVGPFRGEYNRGLASLVQKTGFSEKMLVARLGASATEPPLSHLLPTGLVGGPTAEHDRVRLFRQV